MNAFLTAHRNACRRAWLQLRNQPLGTLLSLTVLGCALAIPLSLYSVLSSMEAATFRIGADAEISVFMDPKATLDDARTLEGVLRKLPGVATARIYSKESALTDLKKRPQLADLVASLDGNPLPHAVILTPSGSDTELLDRIRKSAATQSGVDRVSADFEWVRKLRKIIKLGMAAILAVAFLVGVAVILVIGNTIRLEVLTRRDEIEVSKLIGASTSFIRRPFLYFGFIAGGLAALIGSLAAIGGIMWANTHITGLAAEYGIPFSITFPNFMHVLTYTLATAFISLIGASWSAGSLARKT